MYMKRLLCLILTGCLLCAFSPPASARVNHGRLLRASADMAVNVPAFTPESVPAVSEAVSSPKESVENGEKPQAAETAMPEPVRSTDEPMEENEKPEEDPDIAASEPAPSETEAALDDGEGVVTPPPAQQPALVTSEAGTDETDLIPALSEADVAEAQITPADEAGHPGIAPDDSRLMDAETESVASEMEGQRIEPDQPPGMGYITYEFVVSGEVVHTQIIGDGDTLTQPATPDAPEGYYFSGWVDEEGRPFDAFGPQTVPAEENITIRLTAAFTPVLRAYFMSDINGGKVISTWETRACHGSVPMYELVVEKHQKLIGWTLEQGNPDGALVSFPHEIDRETRYYPVVHDAKWITFDTSGGLPLSPIGVIRGDTVHAPTPVRAGYTFLGWKNEHNEPVSMPCVVLEDMRLTALWKADDGISYCVVHLLENAEDSAYGTNEQIAPTQHLTGTAGSMTQAEAYDLGAQGFTVQQVEQKRIAGDGSTIVTVRYTRNVYQVLFYSTKSASAYAIPELTITAKHGANIEMLWPSMRFPQQYTSGWFVSLTKSTIQTCLSVMPVGGKSFWKREESGRYTVLFNYYVETLPGEKGAIEYQGKSLKLYKTDICCLFRKRNGQAQQLVAAKHTRVPSDVG